MSKLKDAVKEYVESFSWKRGSDYSQKYCHDAFIAGAEWQQQKAIEAFNEAMIYFESPDCPTAEEALKHFIACLGLKLDSSCSEKPNNWICGNCDAYCECSITGAKHDNPACPAFDNSVLSQLNSKDHETKTS